MFKYKYYAIRKIIRNTKLKERTKKKTWKEIRNVKMGKKKKETENRIGKLKKKNQS